MRHLAEAWPDPLIVQQLVAQIPWGHDCILLDKIESRLHDSEGPADDQGHL